MLMGENWMGCGGMWWVIKVAKRKRVDLTHYVATPQGRRPGRGKRHKINLLKSLFECLLDCEERRSAVQRGRPQDRKHDFCLGREINS